ncbi:HIT domain-containing protein [Phytohalomonas tamaricis]|uniref:HIT domain-containing protein n=1 Tax=Phytohalomonas tamaricis TaxID=2081032 RepID=UPI000D0AEA42|nr:HIT family protein [Phytohalomonas tamaricis]
MAPFELHSRLAADTAPIASLPLCHVLLMNDARYPWVILVPAVANIREIYDLTHSDQTKLWQEITAVGETLMTHFNGDKLNIGALGNQVPQLHVHVIVRFGDDAAWPGPVWGQGQAVPYDEPLLSQRVSELRQRFEALTL